jgi:hypothetical protein
MVLWACKIIGHLPVPIKSVQYRGVSNLRGLTVLTVINIVALQGYTSGYISGYTSNYTSGSQTFIGYTKFHEPCAPPPTK